MAVVCQCEFSHRFVHSDSSQISSCSICQTLKCNFFRATDTAHKIINAALNTLPSDLTTYINKTPFPDQGVMCSPDTSVFERFTQIPLIGSKIGEINECSGSTSSVVPAVLSSSLLLVYVMF
eukprot:Blabericola_migrator_1__7017@NODE_3559_length_1678_cov_273_127250_g1778_i1_p2_GENE_NODE_3559_length_1678_cov_273_127250_g1778_i1NODE_3559_length_1678_cov_273_127250_g1778_i1_p2_ORF_typecomplete_len122_score14_64_NODE_3559_length_1678_cov_273_127250_g1778_i18931258